MKKVSLLGALLLAVLQVYSQSSFWNNIEEQDALTLGEASIGTHHCRYISIDIAALRSYLNTAPDEQQFSSAILLEVPLPDGRSVRFRVVKVPVMAPELAAKYPQIGTWAGQGVDNPAASIRLDITQWGFHAMTLSPEGSVFIDPYNQASDRIHKVYFRNDAYKKVGHLPCGYEPSMSDPSYLTQLKTAQTGLSSGNNTVVNRSWGQTLRVYSAAIACTGEYAQFHGGTVTGALAAIVTSLNRVTGVYEKEVAIRMTLVANNDTLIFLNPGTDPYDNNNGGNMLGQNQTTVSARIGGSGYDIGHVYSTGGGGIAGLGVVCNASQKARGVTGSSSPVGDPFDIDYVAHEMGHQFGANHTFNSTQGGCAGNRVTPAAFEPGSGATIMAYAGLCGSNNIQNNSDPYFHTHSADEILNYTSTGATGSICFSPISTGNNLPVVNFTSGDHSIPFLTPFMLTVDASDPDGDTLTYCWEQHDLGPSGSQSNPTGNAPTFRSFNPSLSPTRIFPRLVSIVNGSASNGEVLPSYARTMTFRITARDNRFNGAGVTYEDVKLTLNVINTGTPFQVTSPNTIISWAGGSQENITWDVSGTDQAPISTSNVDILLSTDGGFNYPDTLAANVPNNGLATVNVPSINTTTARIMVKSRGNVFFDISNTNFTISTQAGLQEGFVSESLQLFPNPSAGDVNLSMAGSFRGQVRFRLFDFSGREVWLQQAFKNSDGLWLQASLDRIAAGLYTLSAETDTGRIVRKLVVDR